ncbi:MAG: hypothetical protein ACLR1D_04880 [Dialister sp.]
MDLFSLWERVLSYIRKKIPNIMINFTVRFIPVSFSDGTFTLMVTEPYLVRMDQCGL